MPDWLVPVGLVAVGFGLALIAAAAVALAWLIFRQAERYFQTLLHRQTQQLTDALTRASADARASTEATLAKAFERAAADRDAAVAAARAESAASMRTEGQKRGAAHWGAVKSAEAVTDIAIEVVTDLQVARARLENMLLKIDWIRFGGNPEAPWPEIVAWHNNGRKAKQES